jgi:hypothetical protein
MRLAKFRQSSNTKYACFWVAGLGSMSVVRFETLMDAGFAGNCNSPATVCQVVEPFARYSAL